MSSSKRSFTLGCWIALQACAIANAQAQGARPSFSGLTLGVDVARHNVIAGALHADVDVLHQVSRVAGTVGLGARAQLPRGLVLGAEVGGGPLQTDLRRAEPSLDIRVRYEGSRQRYIGAQLGQVVGRGGRTLIYAYVSEMTRRFDVTIEGGFGGSSTFPIVYQKDEQGLLRYGLGAERILNRWLSLRTYAGSSRADFGSRQTNIRVDRPLEFGIGGVARLRLRAGEKARE